MVVFLEVDDLLKYSTISDNVDNKILNVAIIDAQEVHIQNALGGKLYKKLISLVDSGDITNPTYADYKTLLDNYVLQSLRYWATAEIHLLLSFKLMNKGVVQQNSDNSEAGDLDSIKYLQAQARNKAEFVTEQMIKYLVNNQSKYPEYSNLNNEDVMPQSTSYFSGLYLGGENDCNRFVGYNDRTKNLY